MVVEEIPILKEIMAENQKLIDDMTDKLIAIKEWYEYNKEEPIPYQRRPTKWDSLGIILRGSTPKAKVEK